MRAFLLGGPDGEPSLEPDGAVLCLGAPMADEVVVRLEAAAARGSSAEAAASTSLTRPLSPVSSLTMMPYVCVADEVKRSLTMPSMRRLLSRSWSCSIDTWAPTGISARVGRAADSTPGRSSTAIGAGAGTGAGAAMGDGGTGAAAVLADASNDGRVSCHSPLYVEVSPGLRSLSFLFMDCCQAPRSWASVKSSL